MFENECENGYERTDSIKVMKDYLIKRYKLKEFDVDRASGFVTATFDTSERYRAVYKEDENSTVHTESIINPDQIDFYLEEKFDCVVLDIGLKSSKTKNGYKKHAYVRFLCDNKFSVPKKEWMSGNRKNR